jgi:hypothetical protein
VLWGGKVAAQDVSSQTQAVQNYNKQAMRAPDLVTTILPLRDGVAISLKLEGNNNPFRKRRGTTLPPATTPRK